jgi:hypothetical protein
VTIYTMSDGKQAVKDAAITAAKIATSAHDGTMVGGGGVPLGVQNYTVVASTIVSRVFQATITIGGGTAMTVTHNLNSKAVTVNIWSVATGELLGADVTTPTLNTIAITALGTGIPVLVSVQG